MTPKDRATLFWLVKEASFTAGHIIGFWSNERIADMDKAKAIRRGGQ